MPRLSPPSPERFTPRQREVHDRIASGPRGRVRGPLALWLHAPDFADRAQHLGEFLRYGTSLGPKLSELVILATARAWSSDYEWFVHAPIASKAGLATQVIDAIANDRPPPFDDAVERAVHAFAAEMLTTHDVSDAVYEACVAAVGETGAIEIGAIIGYYILGAITLATARLELPDGAVSTLPKRARPAVTPL